MADLDFANGMLIMTFEFGSQPVALGAYDECARVLEAANDTQGSVYRVTLNDTPYIVIVADIDHPKDLDRPIWQLFYEACQDGTATLLVPEVEALLIERSEVSRRRRGGFWEKRGVNEVIRPPWN